MCAGLVHHSGTVPVIVRTAGTIKETDRRHASQQIAMSTSWVSKKLPSPKPPVTDPFVYSQFLGIHKISSAAIAASAQHQALSGARSARDVMLLLNAGFTSVREMAGYGIQLDQAIEEGSLVGPKIYSSNCIISPTGGHADAHDMPMDWFCDAVNHGLPCYVVR